MSTSRAWEVAMPDIARMYCHVFSLAYLFETGSVDARCGKKCWKIRS